MTTAPITTGLITQASLTITATTNTKTYDATTSGNRGNVGGVHGLQGNDTVVGPDRKCRTGSNAGSSKTLSVSTYIVNDGNGGNNYTVTTVTNTVGVINKASLTITATTNTKTYDSTTTAAATPTVTGLQGNDTVTGLAEFDNANAGTSKTLSVSAYAISDGNSGNNYVVTTVTSTSGLINPASLTISANTNTKTYDSTTTAATTPTVTGLFGGDTVTPLAEVYSNANAGSGLTLSVSPYTVVDGNNGNNYAVSIVSNATGLILKAPLKITAPTFSKTYDATTSASAFTVTTAFATLTGLSGPRALAVDGNGNLFVANNGNGTGTTVSEFASGATTPSATLTGLNGPVALAFDGSGNFYVANNNGTTVSKFAPGATTPSATLTGLSSPDALALDGSGRLYVANFSSNKVSRFAAGATTAGATLTGLSSPDAMAFDESGNLFVANFGNNTVNKFAPGATTASTTLTGASEARVPGC